MKRTKGELEASISEAIVKFEKDYLGRGPEDVRSWVLGDLIVVRLKGVLTKAELRLAQETENPRGRDLVKQVRIELLEKGRPLLESVVNELTGRELISLHTDISVRTGERIIAFTLDRPVASGD
jgi:uncharacterized protein YbcI